MIKSKIDARERALEFVRPSDFTTVEEQIACAKKIEQYLIGDAELPDTVPSAEDATVNAIERILATSLYTK